VDELQQLRERWQEAEARLHRHLHERHRGHLTDDERVRIDELDPEIADDLLGDPGEIEAAAEEARVTYDAYVQGVRTLGQGMG
jgi:hypothetical protein